MTKCKTCKQEDPNDLTEQVNNPKRTLLPKFFDWAERVRENQEHY